MILSDFEFGVAVGAGQAEYLKRPADWLGFFTQIPSLGVTKNGIKNRKSFQLKIVVWIILFAGLGE